MSDINQMIEVNVSLLLFSALVIAFLLIGSLVDSGRKRPFMKCFICLLVADILMQLGEAGIWAFMGSPERIPLLKLCCVLSFGAGDILVLFFFYCMLMFFRERGTVSLLPAHIAAIACGILFLLVLISTQNGMFFTFDSQGMFVDGPLGWVVSLYDLIALLTIIAMILRHIRLLSVREAVFLLCYCILPLFSALLVNVWYPTPEYLTTTLLLIIVYVLFHRKLARELADKEKQLLQKELELSKSRVDLLMSQIEPHFLFNSLSTIKHLCRTEPREAMEAVDEFSGFLRGSMDAMTQSGCITFEKELEFVDSYLRLEQRRFGDRLRIIYDIRAGGFLVPALSIQTIAENAVRHGIQKKPAGGTLTITSREEGQHVVVTVTDDGVGFEVEDTPADGKNHVGLINVRNRLSLMCGGSLEIQSVPGEGTKVVLLFPVDGQQTASERSGQL